jgi:tetratricopeptide (TPR) repeat protein
MFTKTLIMMTALTWSLSTTLSPIQAKELEERKWIEAKTENFAIYSTLSERKTIKLLKNLDALRQAAPKITNIQRTDSTIPTHIFAVKSSSDFEKFGIDRNYAGWIKAGLRNNTILIRDTPNMDEAGIGLHEYAHFLTFNATDFAYPMWFQEGFAEYLSGTHLSGNRFDVGRMPESRYLSLVRGNWLSAQQLLVSGAYESLNDYQKSMFYAQSWALVHFLMSQEYENGSFGTAMDSYLQMVASGVGETEAFEATMGLAPHFIEGRLKSYIRRCCMVYRLMLDTEGPDYDPVIRKMTRTEISKELGNAALVFDQAEVARRWFSIAAEDEASRAQAEAGFAALAVLDGDGDKAVDHFETALAIAPDDVNINIDFGMFWLERAFNSSFPSERDTYLANARRSLVAAWKLNNTLPEIYYANGQGYLLEGADINKAIEMFEEAAYLHPSSLDIQAVLAETYARAGRENDALLIAKSIVNKGHGGGRPTQVARAIISRLGGRNTSESSPDP